MEETQIPDNWVGKQVEAEIVRPLYRAGAMGLGAWPLIGKLEVMHDLGIVASFSDPDDEEDVPVRAFYPWSSVLRMRLLEESQLQNHIRHQGLLAQGLRLFFGVEYYSSPRTLPLVWGIRENEKRSRRAAMLYEIETVLREVGQASEFVYDDQHDLYRFPDGEFAFSKDYLNEGRLRELGFIGQAGS